MIYFRSFHIAHDHGWDDRNQDDDAHNLTSPEVFELQQEPAEEGAYPSSAEQRGTGGR